MKKAKGSLRHLRRYAAPWYYPISVKEYAWTVKPRPGPHALDKCIPLGIILRDVLGYARTMREARRILGERKVKIDGRIITDYKFPVGLMDVIELIPSGEIFRVLPHPSKFLYLKPISSNEANLKICRIENKTMVKGGNIQLNLHDGRNILIKISNPFEPVEDVYKTLDSVLITIPDQQIVEHIKLKEGAYVLVIDGRNVGAKGRLKSVVQIFKRRRSIATLVDDNGNEIRTILDYIFPIGHEKPLIEV
ncbi:MAG: 30S ribosomal protein S4e [Thermofilum sp. ex4484_79]|nr:MAG: 30S ribosomal protein S4e [Thermofilum sp. ex4484_79]